MFTSLGGFEWECVEEEQEEERRVGRGWQARDWLMALMRKTDDPGEKRIDWRT
jgi:hypothetical protein